jgi:hypothetical protein
VLEDRAKNELDSFRYLDRFQLESLFDDFNLYLSIIDEVI